jgi:hypothetical protein
VKTFVSTERHWNAQTWDLESRHEYPNSSGSNQLGTKVHGPDLVLGYSLDEQGQFWTLWWSLNAQRTNMAVGGNIMDSQV